MIARPTLRAGRLQRHKAGQILILRAQTVRHPATDRWANKVRRAGVQEKRRGTVSHALGVHRLDEAQIVHQLGRVGEQLGNVLPALAVLLEVPQRLHELSLALFAKRPEADTGEVVVLAVIAIQLRLVVVGIHMARAAGHEKENHALGSRRKHRVPLNQCG